MKLLIDVPETDFSLRWRLERLMPISRDSSETPNGWPWLDWQKKEERS
jgi:hypothetical protein